jgi:hypothetical protein
MPSTTEVAFHPDRRCWDAAAIGWWYSIKRTLGSLESRARIIGVRNGASWRGLPFLHFPTAVPIFFM